jgi:hypothetical protein
MKVKRSLPSTPKSIYASSPLSYLVGGDPDTSVHDLLHAGDIEVGETNVPDCALGLSISKVFDRIGVFVDFIVAPGRVGGGRNTRFSRRQCALRWTCFQLLQRKVSWEHEKVSGSCRAGQTYQYSCIRSAGLEILLVDRSRAALIELPLRVLISRAVKRQSLDRT